ncbi:Uncharacterised protein [Salmonella enterica subsp. enterica]|uniref:Uncharacterized protein n=1 Tax=Salmonella enterica I TaxID=59201 RepID=A0A447MVC7_SALET|nr:Uncharacterised protein [Salmonella enterica subsp. enterica]
MRFYPYRQGSPEMAMKMGAIATAAARDDMDVSRDA